MPAQHQTINQYCRQNTESRKADIQFLQIASLEGDEETQKFSKH
jgi:hypothetical protein